MKIIRSWRKPHWIAASAAAAGLLVIFGLGLTLGALDRAPDWARWAPWAPKEDPVVRQEPADPVRPPTEEPEPAVESLAWPPMVHVEAPELSPGEVAEIAVTAYDIPDPGLGRFDLEISFMPESLIVLEVLPGEPPWTENSVSVSNHQGRITLSNAQEAGRFGDSVLARIRVEYIGAERRKLDFRIESSSFLSPTGTQIPVFASADQVPLPLPGEEPPALGWLRVEGNRVVNQWGIPIIFRGVNIENREWIWAQRPDVSFDLAAVHEATAPPPHGWGSNIVILAVASGPINRGEALYLEHLDLLVAAARSNGAYTLLAHRYAEPNDEQAPMPDDAAQQAMTTLAARYANEPSVLYGLHTEPHDVTWEELKPRFISMIDAIRAENPRALVVAPGTRWSRYVHWALDDPIPREGVVYRVHYYDSFDIVESRYRLPEVAARFPVLLGEFGTGSQMSIQDVALLLDLAESLGISWAAWLFHDRGCPCMLSDAVTFSPSAYGAEIQRRLRSAPASIPLSFREPEAGTGATLEPPPQ